MENMYLKVDVIQSEKGIRSLDDIVKVLEYLMEGGFYDHYREDLEWDLREDDLLKYDPITRGYVEFSNDGIKFTMYDPEHKSQKDIGNIWLLKNDNWKLEIDPVLGSDVDVEKWHALEKEFIEKWNAKYKYDMKIEKKDIGNGYIVNNMGYGRFEVSNIGVRELFWKEY